MQTSSDALTGPVKGPLVPARQPSPRQVLGSDAASEARQRLINRELSWLDFNARVLALAEDRSLPVLERAKFLAIFSQNLDEFFQVRVANLQEQQRAGLGANPAEELPPAEQLSSIRERTADLLSQESAIFTKEVMEDLATAGITLAGWDDLEAGDHEFIGTLFDEMIFPVLTPLAVDPAHPFPFISNLSLNLLVMVSDPGAITPRIARVKLPQLLPRFVALPDGKRFVPLEQVIAAHLGRLFPGMTVVAHYPFRVTRDADLEADDAEADLLTAVETAVRRRRRSPQVVRLEIAAHTPAEVQTILMRELELDEHAVYLVDGPLDLSSLWSIYSLDRPDLKAETWAPVTQPRLSAPTGTGVDCFRVLGDGDVLVHLPYDSFTTSVEAFLDQAARDPSVLAIKQTLYRTSSTESPIVKSLIRAAESGKQVVVVVELKARFDEEANIAWARALEKAGVHVVYGMVGLKTHAKVSLVVRQEGARIRRYGHIGTGNYNPETARTYEDIGILTADPDMGSDLSELFNYLTGYSHRTDYRRLLAAPTGLRARLLSLIRREADKRDGRIIIKVNHLGDRELVEALYDASRSGTEIDLIVRSVCKLRPGVAGMSENIRVRSIVGRFLEHSRIYRFGRGPKGAFYIGSADLMTRNLDERVEALAPVVEPALKARLNEILEVCLSDDELAWELSADGSWTKAAPSGGVNTHRRLHELALARARAPQRG